MKLDVFERLLLRQVMPQIQGNFGHIKEAREVLENLFSPAEEEALQIHVVEDGRRVEWKTQDEAGHPIPQEKEVAFSDGLHKKIARVLQIMDAQEELKVEHYALYEKFIPPKAEAKAETKP